MYNWQYKNWPTFKYKTAHLNELFIDIAQRSGKISGIINALPIAEESESNISKIISESIATSAIEGEYLKRSDVASSIKKNLGIAINSTTRDKRAIGIAKMMLAVKEDSSKKLSATQLHNWHKALMFGNQYINAGQWRSGKEPMRIISGSIGKEIIHFEAPPSNQVAYEMKQFISWYNQTAPSGTKSIKNPSIRTALAHLYFESIHPYEDGNGRIGRALAEKTFNQTIGSQSYCSFSKILLDEQKEYYKQLKNAQSTLVVSEWITFFTSVIHKALLDAEKMISFTLKKVQFFERHNQQINTRQKKMLQKVLAHGIDEWEGGMSAKKYMSINKTSKPTATRDLQDLVKKNIIKPKGGGRSITYEVVI